MRLMSRLALPCLLATSFAAAHASTVSGTAYCGLPTNSGGQGSGYAIKTPDINSVGAAESASEGVCATFTSTSINYNTGYGNPGKSLASFLSSSPGTTATFTAQMAKNGAPAATATGSQDDGGTLFVLTGDTFLSAGSKITFSHDDGALLYITGNGLSNFLISPSNSGNQTTAGQAPFTLPSSVTTGNYSFELIYNSNYMQPAELVSNINVAQTPEPASIALFGSGLLGVYGAARRRFVRS